MQYNKAVSAALIASTLAVFACSDSAPLAPQQSADSAMVAFSNGSTLSSAGGLAHCAVNGVSTAARMIGPKGGTVKIGKHRLVIPRGALRDEVLITATTVAGQVNQITFGPHGLQFAVPARLEMRYDNCNVPTGEVRIAYVGGGGVILYYVPSDDNGPKRKVVGSIDHFSDYAVAW
jgi:hypothetical protein